MPSSKLYMSNSSAGKRGQAMFSKLLRKRSLSPFYVPKVGIDSESSAVAVTSAPNPEGDGTYFG